MSRTKQILLGGLIVLVFLSFIGFNVFKMSFDKEKQLYNLYEAVDNKDVDYIKQHLYIDGKPDPTEKEVKKIINLLSEVGVYFLYGVDSTNDNIYIFKEGKEKIIYDRFVIGIKTVKLELSSSVQGAEIYLDGKLVGETDENYEFYYEGLIPGTYKIKVVYDGEHGKDQVTDEVFLYHDDSDTIMKEYYLDIEDTVAEESNIESELDALIYSYEVGLVDAINYNDYSYAEPYIAHGSKLYKMQHDLVKYLNKKGVTEEFLSYEIKEINRIDDNNYSIIVTESHLLYSEDGTEKTVTNTWEYTATKVGDKFMLDNLSSLK